MVKIKDLFSDVACDLSNQTIPPSYHSSELFSSKNLNLAQISSADRLTGSLIGMALTINASRRICKNLFYHLYNILFIGHTLSQVPIKLWQMVCNYFCVQLAGKLIVYDDMLCYVGVIIPLFTYHDYILNVPSITHTCTHSRVAVNCSRVHQFT